MRGKELSHEDQFHVLEASVGKVAAVLLGNAECEQARQPGGAYRRFLQETGGV